MPGGKLSALLCLTFQLILMQQPSCIHSQYFRNSLGQEDAEKIFQVATKAGEQILNLIQDDSCLEGYVCLQTGFKSHEISNFDLLVELQEQPKSGCNCTNGLNIEDIRNRLHLPDFQLTSKQIHHFNETFEERVTDLIADGWLRPTKNILQGLLSNTKHPVATPDVVTFADNIEEFLNKIQGDEFAAESDGLLLESMLRSVAAQNNETEPQIMYQLLQLISSYKNMDENLSNLLLIMRADEYPEDVIKARDQIIASTKVPDHLPWCDKADKLLAHLAKLTTTPNENPLSVPIHVVFSHYRMKYLAMKGLTFHPKESFDIAFLLNSFLTIKSPSLLNQMYAEFLRKDFHWQEFLSDFDYTQYSQPRTLLNAMIRALLKHPEAFKICDAILFNYFLNDTPNWISTVFHDEQVQPIYMQALSFQHKKHPTPKCFDEDAIKIIDPDSLIESLEPSSYTEFVKKLILTNPAKYSDFPYDSRVDIIEEFLKRFITESYGSTVSEALQSISFTGKAYDSVITIFVCPEELENIQQFIPSLTDTEIEDISDETLEESTELPEEEESFEEESESEECMEEKDFIEDSKSEDSEELEEECEESEETVEVEETEEETSECFDESLEEFSIEKPEISDEIIDMTTMEPECNIVDVIDQDSILEIIAKEPHTKFIQNIILWKPLRVTEFTNMTTREEIFKAALMKRKEELNDDVLEYIIPEAVKRMQISYKGQLPPIIERTCEDLLQYNITSKEEFDHPIERPKLPCVTVKTIDPYSIIEIMPENHHNQFIRDIIMSKPILAADYPYSERLTVFKAVLLDRSAYEKDQGILYTVHEALQKMKTNYKGKLPLEFLEMCQTEEKLTPLDLLEGIIPGLGEGPVPCDNSTVPTEPPPEESYEEVEDEEECEEEFESPMTRSRTSYRKCEDDETMSQIVNIASLFNALRVPVPEHIKSKMMVYKIPQNDHEMHTKKEVLIGLLNNVQDDFEEEMLKKDVENLKQDITDDGTEMEAPQTFYECLPTSLIEKVIPDCLENEEPTLIVDPESLFAAFSANVPNATYVKARILDYVIPYEEGLTKGYVLKQILADLQKGHASERLEKNIDILLRHILEDGAALDTPETKYECMEVTGLKEDADELCDDEFTTESCDIELTEEPETTLTTSTIETTTEFWEEEAQSMTSLGPETTTESYMEELETTSEACEEELETTPEPEIEMTSEPCEEELETTPEPEIEMTSELWEEELETTLEPEMEMSSELWEEELETTPEPEMEMTSEPCEEELETTTEPEMETTTTAQEIETADEPCDETTDETSTGMNECGENMEQVRVIANKDLLTYITSENARLSLKTRIIKEADYPNMKIDDVIKSLTGNEGDDAPDRLPQYEETCLPFNFTGTEYPVPLYSCMETEEIEKPTTKKPEPCFTPIDVLDTSSILEVVPPHILTQCKEIVRIIVNSTIPQSSYMDFKTRADVYLDILEKMRKQLQAKYELKQSRSTKEWLRQINLLMKNIDKHDDGSRPIEVVKRCVSRQKRSCDTFPNGFFRWPLILHAVQPIRKCIDQSTKQETGATQMVNVTDLLEGIQHIPEGEKYALTARLAGFDSFQKLMDFDFDKYSNKKKSKKDFTLDVLEHINYKVQLHGLSEKPVRIIVICNKDLYDALPIMIRPKRYIKENIQNLENQLDSAEILANNLLAKYE